MPDFDELYPGRFVKGTTLDGPTTVKIVSMVGEKLKDDEDQEKLKAILTVMMRNKKTKQLEQQELVWNKTNAILTSHIFGRDYAQWAGKLITIAFDPSIMFGKEKKGGIRVCGSPQMNSAIEVSIKRPRRKKPEVYILQPTRAPVGPEQTKKEDEPTPAATSDWMLIWQSHLHEPTDTATLDAAWAKVKTQPMSKEQLADLARLYSSCCDRLRAGAGAA